MSYLSYAFHRILFLFFLFLLLASPALAANPLIDNPLLNKAAEKSGYNIEGQSDTFFVETLGKVVFALISFLGMLFVLLVIYGAYVWMYARGNESEVDRAKHIIRDAVIGIIVLAASYSIWLLLETFLFS